MPLRKQRQLQLVFSFGIPFCFSWIFREWGEAPESGAALESPLVSELEQV